MTTIEILSDLRSQYNCFDEKEEPTYRALSEAIKALSSKINWIPVEEDLPEYFEEVWVTVHYHDAVHVEFDFVSTAIYDWEIGAWVNPDNMHERFEYVNAKVLAWMPIPTPSPYNAPENPRVENSENEGLKEEEK